MAAQGSGRVSARGLAVLHAIVGDYVASNEPVGSKAIVERYSFGVSAATIRNDMAMLEDEQLISAPHTSSGRVPTDKGFRLYVDTLANIRPLSAAQQSAIERFLGESRDLDEVLSRTVRMLSQLTNQVAVVQYPSLRRTQLRHIDLVPLAADRILCVLILGNGVVEQQIANLPSAKVTEAWVHGLRDQISQMLVGRELEIAIVEAQRLSENVYEWANAAEVELVQNILEVVQQQLQANRSERIAIAGTANLSRPGEFSAGLHSVLEAIEEQVTLLKLFGELARDGGEFAASIGSENDQYGLSDAAVIAANYESTGELASGLGVLGPVRMDYAQNIATVRAVARYLNQTLGDA